MPIYSYYCQRCQYEWDDIVKLDESNAPDSCAQCQAPEIERLPNGGTGFKLTGSGFYNTDYGGKQPKSTSKVFFTKKTLGDKSE